MIERGLYGHRSKFGCRCRRWVLAVRILNRAAARVEYVGGIARRESQKINAAAERRNAGLENCIFYILPMYEFSLRVGKPGLPPWGPTSASAESRH